MIRKFCVFLASERAWKRKGPFRQGPNAQGEEMQSVGVRGGGGGGGGGGGAEVPGPPQTRHEEPGSPKKVDRHNNLLNHFSE